MPVPSVLPVAVLPTTGWATLVVLGVVVGAVCGALFARRRPDPLASQASRMDDWALLPVAIARCDSDWRITATNPAFTALLGYPAAVARGLTMMQLVTDEDRQRIKRRLGAASGVPRSLQTRCRRPDGADVSVRWLPAPSEQGGYWVVLAPAAREDAPPPEGVGAISAALREPLQAVVGSAEILAISPGDPGALETLRKAGVVLAEVLDGLVDNGTQKPTTRAKKPAPTRSPRTPSYVPRVLVVEDHEVNARVVRHALERLGYAADHVENGAKAVAAVERTRYDAVLMDCQMPVMDGYEATRRIRERERSIGEHLPIVAVTAHALVGDRDRCMEVGMDDYLTKPVQLDQLRQALEHWAGPPSGGDEEVVVDEAALGQLRELLGDEFGATVHAYTEDAAEAVAASRVAFDALDWDEFVRRTHSLKSSSAYLGAQVVSEICERLVRKGRSKDTDGVPALVDELDRAVSRSSALLIEKVTVPA